MNPITAVRSCGWTTTERKAALGAISMEARDDRIRRKNMEPDAEDGTGISERAMADGRWVKTMVFTRPIRLDSEAATTDEIAERIPVMKKRVPRSPSASLNLTW